MLSLERRILLLPRIPEVSRPDLNSRRHILTVYHPADPQISQTPDFRNRLNSLDHLLQNFFAGLPHPATIPVSPGAGNLHSLRQLLLTINLVALAQITLHRPFMSSHATSHKRCVDSAVRAVQSLNGLSEFAIANPMCMVSVVMLRQIIIDSLNTERCAMMNHDNDRRPWAPSFLYCTMSLYTFVKGLGDTRAITQDRRFPPV